MTDVGRAIWLYGSHARGDSDLLSDVDVLFVGAAHGELSNVDAKYLAGLGSVSVSHYDWHELRSMASYGSLFLHHIRLEGRALHEDQSCSGQLRALLAGMPHYQLARRDITGFRTALNDVEGALSACDTMIYELAVLGTVIRHSAILGCWLLGTPLFSRYEPVARFVEEVGVPRIISLDFTDLYQYRLYMDGRIARPKGNVADADAWLSRARKVVDAVERTYERVN